MQPLVSNFFVETANLSSFITDVRTFSSRPSSMRRQLVSSVNDLKTLRTRYEVGAPFRFEETQAKQPAKFSGPKLIRRLHGSLTWRGKLRGELLIKRALVIINSRFVTDKLCLNRD